MSSELRGLSGPVVEDNFLVAELVRSLFEARRVAAQIFGR
jgi:hypothetical protein